MGTRTGRSFVPALGLAIIGFCVACTPAAAQSMDDLAGKSIEELMNIQVTSASRKEQKLSHVPAAIYVLSQEMIERSGAATVPDLLRLIPGVQVAQLDIDHWAVSVRGFNAVSSNKLLLLVDGRTVYTPTFSSVYWDQISMPVDTIARIEVIRGPGGTVWGANAVNGVISIITRNANDTKGTRVEVGAGSSQRVGTSARFGGGLGSVGAYRASARFQDFATIARPGNPTANATDYKSAQAGFRFDLKKGSADKFLVEGNGFSNVGDRTAANFALAYFAPQGNYLKDTGFDMTSRWTHTYSDRAEASLQVYSSQYNVVQGPFNERSSTVDVDFQDRLQIGNHNELVWGLGFRSNGDRLSPLAGRTQALLTTGIYSSFNPPSRQYNLYSSFIQDEISLGGNVSLQLGSKFEHNAFSGFEYEPSARAAWTPRETTTIWGAVSRAIRQPSRVDTGSATEFYVPNAVTGATFDFDLRGQNGLRAETLLDYEVGARQAIGSKLLVDAAGFYSNYRDLIRGLPNYATASLGPAGYTVLLPYRFGNYSSSRNYGADGTITANILPRWRLEGTASWLNIDYATQIPLTGLAIATRLGIPQLAPYIDGVTNTSGNTFSPSPYGEAPQMQGGVSSQFDLTRKWAFDCSVFRVGKLIPTMVPAYTRVDGRLAYKPRHGLEFSLVGQNLTRTSHYEFTDTLGVDAAPLPRSVFGKVVFSF